MTADFNQNLIETLPALKAFAVVLTRNREMADDLVQDTALRAIDRWEQFMPGTSLKAWAFTLMRNIHIDRLRQQRRRPTAELDETLMDQVATVAACQENKLMLQDVLTNVMKLGREQREALMLVAAQGLSYEQTAEICGCPIGTIRSRISRARRELERSMMGNVPAGEQANVRPVPARASDLHA